MTDKVDKPASYGDGVIARRFATVIAARGALRKQADEWAEIASGSSGGGGGQGGEPADPVVARILRSPEGHGLADQCTDVADRIEAWMRQGNALARVAQRLLPMEHPIAEMLAKHRDIRQAGAGVCQRCGRTVPGIRENPLLGIEPDRLKSGFCFGQPPNCYNAWLATGQLNRARFIHDYKHISGTDETPGTSPDDANAVLSASSGGELRPDHSPYCEHVPPHLTDPDSFRCTICAPQAAGAA